MSSAIPTKSFFCFLLFAIVVSGQKLDVESLFDGREESEDQSALVEYLESLLQNPLDINKASIQQLSSIPWISPIVAMRIVKYRLAHGPFRRLDQLHRIKGADKDFEKASPFLKVTRRPAMNVSIQGRHRMTAKVQDARGFLEAKYAGSKLKAMNRLRGGYTSHFQFGLLSEKDAGESRFDDLKIGHVQVQAPAIGAKIIVGHFTAEFGQGLVFWGPYKAGKGSDPVAPAKQRGRALHPYLSVNENNAFYGLAISEKIGGFECHAFTSSNYLDAHIENDEVVSTPISGLHRTASERAAKDKLRETVHGGSIAVHIAKSASVGATFQKSNYSAAFLPKDGVEQYDFSGQSNSVAGLNFDFTFSDYNVFGETARSASGGMASTAGCYVDATPVELVLSWRSYGRLFQNKHGLAFGEKSGVNNETGVYGGMRWRMDGKTTLSCYSDYYRFPWPENTLPMPGAGHDFLLMLEHKFQSSLKATVRFRSEKKSASRNVEDRLSNSRKILVSPRKSFARLQIDFNASSSIHVKSRIEFSFCSNVQHIADLQKRAGVLIYQDFSWRFARHFRLQTRWSFFDAPAYELRFYQFENDLPGVMRLKMLSGRGSRWYGLFTYKWRKKMTWTLKFENTFYSDRNKVGSGLDVICGPRETAAGLQMDWRF